MTDLFYRCLIFVSRLAGVWLFKAGAWCVATGYFIFFPRRVQVSMQFYRALFPGSGFSTHLFCAWRQFHNFTTVFLDRFLARSFGAIAYSQEGGEHMDKIARSGTGAIMLMSHLGNWELGAAYLSSRSAGPAIKLLLYLGEKQGEQIEGRQKKDLARQGVRIIATQRDAASPFDLVEGINFLKDGGFVSMTGDRLWGAGQRSVAVKFLGQEARLPEAPFQFALLSGAPLIVFFVTRAGSGQYHGTIFPPIAVTALSRAERGEAIRRAAQQYAALLESMVRRHPGQWYHFERFIAGPAGS